MNALKSFSMGLIALLITAMLLVACGDSPTPVPAATTAPAATVGPTVAPTTAAATTVAATTAAPTTAASTKVAPTMAAPATATALTSGSGGFKLPTGARVLKLSPALTRVLEDSFSVGVGSTGVQVKIESYISNGSSEKVASFFDQSLTSAGYTFHPDTQQSEKQGNMTILTANFTRGNLGATIVLEGPLDAAGISDIAKDDTGTVNPDTAVTKQLKVGDTIILTFVGTLTAGTTAAPVASGLPVPSGTRALRLSTTLSKYLSSQFAAGAGTSAVKMQTYVAKETPGKLGAFYDQQLPSLGYQAHPDLLKNLKQNNVTFLSTSFTKGNEGTILVFVGPLDVQTITELSRQDPGKPTADEDLLHQLSFGDTMIMTFVFALPNIAATTAPAATAAPTAAPTSGSMPGYNGAAPLKLSAAIESELIKSVGLSNAAVTAFVTKDTPAAIAPFFNETLEAKGYSVVPNSQSNQNVGSLQVLTAAFAQGKNYVVISLSGPYDKAGLTSVFHDDASILAQVKQGDTVILIFEASA